MLCSTHMFENTAQFVRMYKISAFALQSVQFQVGSDINTHFTGHSHKLILQSIYAHAKAICY